MPSDPRIQQAREHHRAVAAALADAEQHRALRDQLIRRVRRDDPERWTYARIAGAVGCSPELVAAIMRAGRCQNAK